MSELIFAPLEEALPCVGAQLPETPSSSVNRVLGSRASGNKVTPHLHLQ